MQTKNECLSDGAYVEVDRSGDVLLYTSNGIGRQNAIVLDGVAIMALLRWLLTRYLLPAAAVSTIDQLTEFRDLLVRSRTEKTTNR